jgi:NTE family protein
MNAQMNYSVGCGERARGGARPRPRTPGVALALGGGAARGWAHIGVLRALSEGGIRPSAIAGTSMGSLVGLFAAAGELDALHDVGRSLDRRTLLSFLDVIVPRSGLLDGRRIVALLRERLPVSDFAALDIPFRAVAANLETGAEVVLKEGDPIEAVRASISVPGLFRPVRHEGGFLVDGGLVNPVPVNVARQMGAPGEMIVVAVDVNHYVVGERPYWTAQEAPVPEVEAEIGRLRLPAPLARLTPSFTLPPWWPMSGTVRPANEAVAAEPSILEVLLSTVAVSEVVLSALRRAADPPDVLICPRVGHIRFLDLHRAPEAFEAGYAAGLESLAEIRRRLALGDAPRIDEAV